MKQCHFMGLIHLKSVIQTAGEVKPLFTVTGGGLPYLGPPPCGEVGGLGVQGGHVEGVTLRTCAGPCPTWTILKPSGGWCSASPRFFIKFLWECGAPVQEVFLRAGSSRFFHVYSEESSQLTNIFQRGWNHQPDRQLMKLTGSDP